MRLRSIAAVTAMSALTLMAVQAQSGTKGNAAEGSAMKGHDHGEGVTFEVDKAHATIGFRVSHLVISKVKGEFTDYTATLDVDGDHLQGAQATIRVDSIDTGNEKRDEHLRSADFFDAGKHPEITFKSTAIKGDKLTGNLTIGGVTKAIELTYAIKGPVTDPWGKTRVGFEASGTINRRDFGVDWSQTLDSGGLVVGDEVEIMIDVEAVKK